MTNGTSGDERHGRVRAGLAFSCEGSSDALWAITQFQIRKRFTASELFSGFLAPDKLQDTTVRFSGVDLSPCPGTLVKIIGKWSDTQKSLLRQSFFENRGIKIRLHGCT